MKKILGLGAIGLFVPAAIASAALFSPAVGAADPGSSASVNVVGEPYARAVAILKGQGVKQRFNGAVTGPGGPPQSACIVDQQSSTSKGVMLLHLNCTKEAAADAAGSAPDKPAPGTTSSGGGGQGTYGGPIGVPVPVG